MDFGGRYQEVVAARINNKITNDMGYIAYAIGDGHKVGMVTRFEAKFMAACDLGGNWDKLAKAPVICYYDNKEQKFLTRSEYEELQKSDEGREAKT